MSQKIRNLRLSHLEPIYQLIQNHYYQDQEAIIKINYHKDFVYWILQQSQERYRIGLTIDKKILGFVCGHVKKYRIQNEIQPVLCFSLDSLHSEIPEIHIYWKELHEKILEVFKESGLKHFVYFSHNAFDFKWIETEPKIYHYKIANCSIPINYAKLESIGFLPKNMAQQIPTLETNPLKLAIEEDLEIMSDLLNTYLEPFDFVPEFSIENADLIRPKKNIVYSFVLKNQGLITDCVVFYSSNMHANDSGLDLHLANLAFYAITTLNLTQLVALSIDKLRSYEVDQVLIQDQLYNHQINLNKFSINELHYYSNTELPLRSAQFTF